MKNVPVTMEFAGSFETIPRVTLPSGYRIRTLTAGEGDIWASIERSVDEFPNEAEAYRRFAWEFQPFPLQMRERCFVLETDGGEPVGTASAWYDCRYRGHLWGRLHWVAIRPEFQGRGLARPLLAVAIKRLLLLHDQAFLDSSSSRETALRLYLDFGFVPVWNNDEERQVWVELAPILNHSSLGDTLQNA